MKAAEGLIAQRLVELESEYWYEVDHHWGCSAHEFYAPGGIFVIGDKRMSGQAEIRNFYQWRQGRGERTARHVVSNFLARVVDDRHAKLDCILSLYAADGAPVLESKPPIMIADVVCHYVAGGGGRDWLLESRVLRPIFMGGERPTIPPDK